MDNLIKILIADDNKEYVCLLSEYINQQEDMSILGEANDGLIALDMILAAQPDVVLLDIILPGIDGLCLMEKVSSIHNIKMPLFIIITAISSDFFINNAFKSGASYYIVKPFDLYTLITRIKQAYNDKYINNPDIIINKDNPFYEERKSISLDTYISRTIQYMGISPHLAGYRYIRDAIVYMVENPELYLSVTKNVYKMIADKYITSISKIDRSIRNAIMIACTRSDNYINIFGNEKPANVRFITNIAEYVRLYYLP